MSTAILPVWLFPDSSVRSEPFYFVTKNLITRHNSEVKGKNFFTVNTIFGVGMTSG